MAERSIGLGSPSVSAPASVLGASRPSSIGGLRAPGLPSGEISSSPSIKFLSIPDPRYISEQPRGSQRINFLTAALPPNEGQRPSLNDQLKNAPIFKLTPREAIAAISSDRMADLPSGFKRAETIKKPQLEVPSPKPKPIKDIKFIPFRDFSHLSELPMFTSLPKVRVGEQTSINVATLRRQTLEIKNARLRQTEAPPIRIEETPASNVRKEDVERVYNQELERLMKSLLNVSSPSNTKNPALVG